MLYGRIAWSVLGIVALMLTPWRKHPNREAGMKLVLSIGLLSYGVQIDTLGMVVTPLRSTQSAEHSHFQWGNHSVQQPPRVCAHSPPPHNFRCSSTPVFAQFDGVLTHDVLRLVQPQHHVLHILQQGQRLQVLCACTCTRRLSVSTLIGGGLAA